MEEYVDSVRPSRSKTKRPEGKTDGYEESLKVPNSVLDGCQDSFTAADEKRQKASTQFFADTGVMALLCRHDRVLWLVNMTSAGEKQHYALALINKLFENIPTDMTIGILYDIGCQMHRSCVKWGFLDAYLDRITFGISVFHAYGHQWPCQMIYHPRKCPGFGFTDGEGCERFWSAIKLLIPSMRVAGFYHRLYTIDTQVRYLDEKSMLGLGQWLSRKWTNVTDKQIEAETKLKNINIAEDVLRREWKAQITEQTKPITRQSKKKGDQAIEALLALKETQKICRSEISKLEKQLLGYTDYDDDDSDDDNDDGLANINTKLGEARLKLKTIEATIKRRREALGVDGRLKLENLLKNKFVQIRMNARALKQRIRDRLRNRKFEIERLERAYRHTMSGKSQFPG